MAAATPTIADEFSPTPGSGLYYAMLYVPAPQRRALTLIETLRAQIASVPLTCSSAEIAFTKLSWWHEEVHRLGNGQARHALTRALLPVQRSHPELAPAARNLIDGILALQQIARFATRAERFAAYDAAHGALWTTHAAVASVTDSSTVTAVRRLGVTAEIACALADLRRFVDGGLALITREYEPPSSLSLGDWHAALMQGEIEPLIDDLRRARRGLDARQSPVLRAVRVAGRLAESTLTEIARDGYRVWERRLELTPLRKLWVSLLIRIAT
ncbi:MAG: squalene/phytoene synthase family protein [Gammaproteobacteria bacterium]|nr:squalene/phytoene synthase family protein [Gammaproteobacteria bacterium]